MYSGAAAFFGEERGKPRWTNPVYMMGSDDFLTRARKSATAENRAFKEKQPLVFLPKAAIMVV